VIAYAGLLLMCAVAYTILQRSIMAGQQFTDKMSRALKLQSRKGMVSLAAYTSAIGFAFLDTRVSAALFIAVAILWFVPDRNIEKALEE
jgi:hypothetical protein